MEIYETEEQQVEAIKKWWKENGPSVIIGLVIGIGGVVGWRYWLSYKETRGAGASIIYQQVLDVVEQGQGPQARDAVEHLLDKDGNTIYAPLAALTMAGVLARNKDIEGASYYLLWVKENAGQDDLKQLARLRLARLLLGQGRMDDALTEVTGLEDGDYRGLALEVKGDILIAKGDPEGARKAYREALSGLAGGINRDVLQMKLDDLGGDAAQSEVTS